MPMGTTGWSTDIIEERCRAFCSAVHLLFSIQQTDGEQCRFVSSLQQKAMTSPRNPSNAVPLLMGLLVIFNRQQPLQPPHNLCRDSDEFM